MLRQAAGAQEGGAAIISHRYGKGRAIYLGVTFRKVKGGFATRIPPTEVLVAELATARA